MANVAAPAQTMTYADIVREHEDEWVLIELLDRNGSLDEMDWTYRLLYHSPQRGRVTAKEKRLLKKHPEMLARLRVREAYKPITTGEELREAFKAAAAEGFASVIKRRRGLL